MRELQVEAALLGDRTKAVPHGICPTIPQRALGNNVFSVGRMPVVAQEGRGRENLFGGARIK